VAFFFKVSWREVPRAIIYSLLYTEQKNTLHTLGRGARKWR
jgi:hypothetical protein